MTIRLLKLRLEPQQLCVFLVTHVVKSITSVVIIIQKQIDIQNIILNTNHLSRAKQHKNNVRNKKIRDTLGVPVAPVITDDNEVQDHIDFPVNNNDDNDISEESTIEAARQYDFDFDIVIQKQVNIKISHIKS